MLKTQSPTTQIDPLNSPHPIPWQWVQAVQSQATTQNQPFTRVYRSPALQSPDGQYAAYSRIQMQAFPNFITSRVSSVLFLEHLKTGRIQTLSVTSPLADNFFTMPETSQPPGTVSILIPVAWSVTCDRLLAREFESQMGTGIASDYAVIWDRQLNQSCTIAPTIDVQETSYSHATLMGWSQSSPDQVLFRVGVMGNPHWPLWAVNAVGETTAAPNDKPTVYGQVTNPSWVGAP